MENPELRAGGENLQAPSPAIPTEHGSARFLTEVQEDLRRFPLRDMALVLGCMALGGSIAYFGAEWTNSPQASHIDVMLTKAMAVPLGVVLGSAIGILVVHSRPFNRVLYETS